MKNEFEENLSQHPLRAIPDDWKHEILAEHTAPGLPATKAGLNVWDKLARIIDSGFAHPKLSLGAAWILILALQLTSPGSRQTELARESQKQSWENPSARLAAIERQFFNFPPRANSTEKSSAKRPSSSGSSPRSQIRTAPEQRIL